MCVRVCACVCMQCLYLCICECMCISQCVERERERERVKAGLEGEGGREGIRREGSHVPIMLYLQICLHCCIYLKVHGCWWLAYAQYVAGGS